MVGTITCGGGKVEVKAMMAAGLGGVRYRFWRKWDIMLRESVVSIRGGCLSRVDEGDG